MTPELAHEIAVILHILSAILIGFICLVAVVFIALCVLLIYGYREGNKPLRQSVEDIRLGKFRI